MNKFGDLYNLFRSKSKGISSLGNKINRLGKKLILSESFDEFYLNLISSSVGPSNLLKDIIEPTSQLQDKLPEFGIEDLAIKMMFQDMRTYLPDDILCKVDRFPWV